MCLAIPGKVLSIENASEPKMGTVNFAGINRKVCLEWLPEVIVGEYVLVHVGFALTKVDEKEALETLELLKQMDESDLDELKMDEHGESPKVPHEINTQSQ